MTTKVSVFCIALTLIVFLSGSCSKPEKIYFPPQLHSLQLEKIQSGEQARSVIDRLHMRPLAPDDNRIASYRGEEGTALIYLTVYSSAEEAENDYQRMTQKISPQNSVFIQGAVVDINGQKVYRCFGMGQTHFVFTHQDLLIWLSVDTMIGREVLASYMRYLNSETD